MGNSIFLLKPDQYLQRILQIYSSVRDQVQVVIPEAEIEHVGSSAINNALSKGDLDVLVRVSKAVFDTALNKIEALGFTIKENTLRTESLCMLETNSYFPDDVAIQLIEKGSEFESFVIFRDRLNADPRLVEQYNQLKIDSASLAPDEYRRRKAQFIEAILGGR